MEIVNWKDVAQSFVSMPICDAMLGERGHIALKKIVTKYGGKGRLDTIEYKNVIFDREFVKFRLRLILEPLKLWGQEQLLDLVTEILDEIGINGEGQQGNSL